ncbi:MAG: hypothetical protein ACO1TE_23615 [Prosthecobacter sp.]
MSESSISPTRVAAFVRQYTHDVRNTINCMDLEMELMQDVITEPEAVTSMNRIREQLRSMEMQMRSLSAAFHEPRPTPDVIQARVLLQIWREKHAEQPEAAQIQWSDKLGDEQVEVDVEMVASAFSELLANAAAYAEGGAGPPSAHASPRNGHVVFELREPKKTAVNPAGWAQPFSNPTRGRYGLGLWAAKRKLEANGARFSQHWDEKESALVTEIGLPLRK